MKLTIETTEEQEVMQLIRAEEMSWILSDMKDYLRDKAKYHPETSCEDIYEYFKDLISEYELWGVIE